MESISSFSSTKLSSVFHAPRYPRRLVVLNVQTHAKLVANTLTDNRTTLDVENETSSYAFKSNRKLVNVQWFRSMNSLDRPFSLLFCNVVDELIDNFIKKSSRPFVDPRFILVDNFAAVQETVPTKCLSVRGTLFACLNDVYIRNGPNPNQLPQSSYHLFDGDKMLHSLRINNNRAIFCSHFIYTYKYVEEHIAGSSVMPNVFSGFNGIADMARG
ncbi:hypothetical protein KI387_016750, partial [Taxus chinensis]